MNTSNDLKKWLEGFLASNPPGTKLPYTRELSPQWSLSYSTITRALNAFVKAGKFVRIKGKGTCIPDSDNEISSVSTIPKISSKQTIVNAITTAISHGELKAGEILSLSQKLTFGKKYF